MLPDPNFPVDYAGCDLHNIDLGLMQDQGVDFTGANLGDRPERRPSRPC
ncbi:MAG: hypothetical protein U0P45_07035 [Acidimicrobiales bacterium]